MRPARPFVALLLLSFLPSIPSPGAPAGPAIELWPEGVPGLRADAAAETINKGWVTGVHRPTMRIFPAPADRATGACVLVCPGGGYSGTAEEKEGDEIAAWLNGLGVHAAVLRYRAKEYGQPAPLRDALRAIRLLRTRAGDWQIEATAIGVIGFSAGGHLAACAATLYDDDDGRTGAEIDAVSARPDFAILVYPVITMGRQTHAGSRLSLLGENPAPELVARYSPNLQVDASTPPLFLVHTVNDQTVDVANSVLMFEAAKAAGVPVEMHLYEAGPHGIGVRVEHPAAREWPKACAAWLARHEWIE